MRRLCCTALVVALVPVALATPADAALQPVRSLSDLQSVPGPSAGPTYLAPIKPLVCKTPSKRKPRKLAAAKALAAARHLLVKKGGRRAVRKLLRTRSLTKPASAETDALAAVAAGKPGAALAALMPALQKHPKDPLLLASASVLMTDVGKPAEGLALADAALKAHAGANGPMGISTAAVALNNRGLALLALSRYSDAVAPLGQAIAKAPLLAEARRNLAVAFLCSGRDALATTTYGDGLHRNAAIPAVEAGDTPGPNVQPKADAVLDLSHGEQGSLPKLVVPPNPGAGVKSADSLDAAFHSRKDEAFSLTMQGSTRSLQTGVTAGFELVRITGIEDAAINWMHQRPDLAAQHAQLLSDEQQMDAQFEKTWLHDVPAIAEDCGNKPTTAERNACYQGPCRSAIDAAHQQWLPVATDGNQVAHDWASGLYNYATAVAANLHNPAAHDATVLLTRATIWDNFATYELGRVASWAAAEKDYSECIDASTGDDEAEQGSPEEPSGIPCPPQLDALHLSIDLSVIKIAVSCESISAGTGLPGVVAPFGNVSYAFKTGTTTAFVGLKTGLSAPGFDVGAKGGFYMTWDGHGNPTDCGVRATASAGTAIPLDMGPSASGKLQYSLAGRAALTLSR